MREQIVERKKFTLEERIRIASKTNNVCAHCGKRVDPRSDDFSIEHIFPISKGGNHDDDNLVALCFDCNQEKSNLVFKPIDYYKYVDQGLLRELQKRYHFYKEDNFWLNTHNYFSEDGFILYTSVSKLNKNAIPLASVKKATFEDYDDIYKFVTKYHKKFNINTDELSELINKILRIGAIYMIQNKSGIIGVVPISTNREYIIDRTYYVLSISGLPCVYQKADYRWCISKVLQKLIGDICLLSPSRNVVLDINIPKNDAFLADIVQDLDPIYEATDDNDFMSCLIFKTLDEENYISTTEKVDDNRNKILERFSNFLQRAMQLKPIKKEKKKN